MLIQIALSKSRSARLEASSKPLNQIQTYFIYLLLSIRSKRDLLLISSALSKLEGKEVAAIEKASNSNQINSRKLLETKLNKLRAKAYPGIIKIYDGVVSGLEKMRELDGVEGDGELSARVEARLAYANAKRCLYLSRSYSLLSQYPSALSLNARAKLYSRQSQSFAQSISMEDEFPEDDPDFIGDILKLSQAEFTSLDSDLTQDYDDFSNAWFVATGGKVGVDDLEVDALELNEGEGKAKEKKGPAFYDVAFNYIAAIDMEKIAVKAGLRGDVNEKEEVEEDDEDEEMESEEEEEVPVKVTTPAKKGWGFGLFGR